ncbi:MAG: thiamine diphosphokinase [Acidimicrobiia bacterium]|nr:thiamine diphosphokinase [Acidimicrobiia bacterium]
MEPIEPSTTRAIIFAGGDIGTRPSPEPDVFVVAADSGWDHAVGLGHHIDLLVGDLDSISPAGLAAAESSETTIERHPSDKDDTDFSLALDAVIDRQYSQLDIYGGEGGRTGHLLGVATALTHERLRNMAITWHVATGSVHPLVDGGTIEINAPVGTTVSLVVLTDCTGVSVEGLLWPLRNDTLKRGSSRGLSNTTNAEQACVSIDTGAMLVIVEGTPLR